MSAILAKLKGRQIRLRIMNRLLRLARKKVLLIANDYVELGNRLKFLASYHVNFGLHDSTLFWPTKEWVDASFSEFSGWKKSMALESGSWCGSIVCS
jgi:hypothetical protein